MSLMISGIRLLFDAPPADALAQACHSIGVAPNLVQPSIYRVSLDARRGKISRVYTVQIDGVDSEDALVERLHNLQVRSRKTVQFSPKIGQTPCRARPVVVGFGPAGLFAGYLLAQYGYRPIIVERGDAMDARDAAVAQFHKTGMLDGESNIQFGEGGAGTYSDGKLTTRINDPLCDEVLRILVAHGAPQEILTQAKPHIGTDVLKHVVVAMRKRIVEMGGEVHFRSKMDGIFASAGKLTGVAVNGQRLDCQTAIFALGHSARDTVQMLDAQGLAVEPKSFSIGVRIEHAQAALDAALYGKYVGHPLLPPAEYNLSVREGDRACYSFCMCPGGHVVAAQTEPQTIVTNGMSYHARDGKNANAALAVSVDVADFADGTALGGMHLQQQIERRAYALTGSHQAPCQLVGDFLHKRTSTKFGTVQPTYPMGTSFQQLSDCLPDFITQHLAVGLANFARKNAAFGAMDAVLTAPETRTSSPVRMSRDRALQSTAIAGVLPCGEGAGYAGGIMSAAVDGMRAATIIMEQYQPIESM